MKIKKIKAIKQVQIQNNDLDGTDEATLEDEDKNESEGEDASLSSHEYNKVIPRDNNENDDSNQVILHDSEEDTIEKSSKTIKKKPLPKGVPKKRINTKESDIFQNITDIDIDW